MYSAGSWFVLVLMSMSQQPFVDQDAQSANTSIYTTTLVLIFYESFAHAQSKSSQEAEIGLKIKLKLNWIKINKGLGIKMT